MDHLARLLFHELADLPPAEREKHFADRQIGPQLRAEVESLLNFDSESSSSLADCVSETAQDMLRSGGVGEPSHCGPYRLVRLLGSGGMGAVYLAERSDGEIRQQVAVKVLHAGADRPAWRDRFLRERQLLANLDHPSIARVIDAGHVRESQPYLVMEYVDGLPIDAYAAAIDLRNILKLFLAVCEGVSHAHRRLIIHRDLKPSNILVDASGQPKLLDFGIAKLLDETGDPTQTVERMLTPNYASPEQLRGANQTTATDVYSLGAVLYKLVTGRSPHQSDAEASQAVEVLTGAKEIPAPSRLNPGLPSDIDYILRKALRHEPEERYVSVEALASDIHAFLDRRPVEARSGDTWYRTRRWLRRYWLPVAAATVTVAGLSLGLYAANRQRAVAQRRFLQVRQLANKVLALDDVIQRLPGSTKARHEIVAISEEYLEALGADGHADADLALEIGTAYYQLAEVQGVPYTANLGQYAQAEQSLRKADALLESVLAASPRNRKALFISASIAHDRMILADADHRRDGVLAQARKTAGRLETLLGAGQPAQSEITLAGKFFSNIALAHKNLHLYNDAIRYARRSIEISRSQPSAEATLGNALSVLADSMRFSGDLEGALQAIREARSSMERAHFDGETQRRTSLFNVLWREGVILGQDGGVNLDRPGEAIAPLQRAFDLTEEWAEKDPNDASCRILVASAGRELGAMLRHRNPHRALAVYDVAILRLGEIKNNVRARRDEARTLAGSSYALRRLNRIGEARARIDTAFRLLSETHDYPAVRIDPDSEAEAALRALGAHLSETGQPRRAAEVYQELLDKMMASKPDLRNDLPRATKFSGIYEALAGLDRRNGEPGRAESVSKLRLALWRDWDRKLPQNPFIGRQLEAASPR